MSFSGWASARASGSAAATTAASQAQDRIAHIEAKLAIAADQIADDTITGDQLRRGSERLKPQLAQERARRAARSGELRAGCFAGTGVDAGWNKTDVETETPYPSPRHVHHHPAQRLR